MPLKVPTPTILEGDYSDWTIYDSFDDAAMYVGDWENVAVINKEETEILLINENYAKRYTIATKTLGSSLLDPSVITGVGIAQAFTKSAYGTYVVWIDHLNNELYILKNGTLLKTLTYTDLNLLSGYVESVSISPKGKYVAVAGRRTGAVRCWRILVGS